MPQKSPQGARVFLVDDHPAMRAGLALLLAQVGHVICGEAENRAQVRQGLAQAQAQIALVDLSLGEESGLPVLADLHAARIPAIVYSMYEDCATITRAFASGALGYVTKREVAAVLLEAIGTVLSGRRYASPRAAQSLADRVLAAGESGQTALTDREEQIMAGLGRAETSAEIAKNLGISVHTVQTYYTRIIEKLGLDGMKALRKLAIRSQASPIGTGAHIPES
jgi:DNA-binding NarL/FixJ family response regulator